jgi:hypothetical protein
MITTYQLHGTIGINDTRASTGKRAWFHVTYWEIPAGED